MKTAVEFLFEEFFKVKWDDMPNRPIIFEQAKQMEKDQIVNAFEQGIEFAFPTNGSYYYNQTYKPETI